MNRVPSDIRERLGRVATDACFTEALFAPVTLKDVAGTSEQNCEQLTISVWPMVALATQPVVGWLAAEPQGVRARPPA